MRADNGFRLKLMRRYQRYAFCVPIESGSTHLGIGDLFMQTPTGALWIECKAPGKGPRSEQRQWGKRLVFNGGLYLWTRENEYGQVEIYQVFSMGPDIRKPIKELPDDLYAYFRS